MKSVEIPGISTRSRISRVAVFAVTLLAGTMVGTFSMPSVERLASMEIADQSTENGAPTAACGGCHLVPPADILPRAAWRDSILRMQQIRTEQQAAKDTPELPPDFAAALGWYEARAPRALPRTADWPRVTGAWLRPRGLTPPDAPPTPVVSDVAFLDVDGDARLELIVCDMRHGMVLLGRPYDADAGLTLVAQVPHPARAQNADLDRDGVRDLLIADLGEFLPRDHDKGAVVWLRGLGGGRFAPFAIGGLPRVADVQAADLDGDGDDDLVVSAFGFRRTGSLLILENRTTDWSRPVFAPRSIDPRPGSVRGWPIDLDRDGRLDIVSLIAQEHEQVIAHMNQGGLTFRSEVLYRAPHPNWGFSGMALADLDGDGDEDLLLANGDTFDDSLLKPYHGLLWLEQQRSGQKLPRFVEHRLADLPGPHGVVAADLDTDGDLDVVASALVAGGAGDDDARLPGVVWLEQVRAKRFERRTLKTGFPRHAAVAAGDYDGDGDADLATGNMATTDPIAAWVDVWENGPRTARPSNRAPDR